jgi:hypothetical protein
MAKEKVTLTVDTGQLEELRRLLGARSMSSTVETALAEYLAKVRHFRAVDEWLAELEREDGPIPADDLDWAERVFDDWAANRKLSRPSRRPRTAGRAG